MMRRKLKKIKLVSIMLFQITNLNELTCNNLNFRRRNNVCYGDIVNTLHIILFRSIDIQAKNTEYIAQ